MSGRKSGVGGGREPRERDERRAGAHIYTVLMFPRYQYRELLVLRCMQASVGVFSQAAAAAAAAAVVCVFCVCLLVVCVLLFRVERPDRLTNENN